MAAKVAFRGGWTCSCVATSLPWVEQDMIGRGIIRQSIDILQLGWRSDVSASAGTHAEGGCVDVAQWNPDAIRCWRDWGWTIQRRDLSGIRTHGHGWPYGCGHLSPAAEYQAREWDAGRNGLVNQGSIAGKWPVKNWRDALEEGVQRMYTLNDIAEAVWKKDGLINNEGFASSAAGDYVSAANALKGLMRQLQKVPGPGTIAIAVDKELADEEASMSARLDALEAKLDAVLAAVAQPPQ